ncbi:hypothetical protein ACQP1U_09700 [Actinomycetota bacterium]|nr:hypothetical protein [Micrococcales bacterium]
MDAIAPTERQLWTMDYAMDMLTHDCMAEAGQDYPLVDYRQQIERPDRRYGVWRLEDAQAFGYALPPDDPTRKRLKELNAGGGTPEWDAAFKTCIESPERAKYSLRAGKAPRAGIDSYQTALASPEGKAIWAAWSTCMKEAGFQSPREGEWIDPAWADADTETEIRTAVADVKCKDQHDTVQKFADLEASYQQPVIDSDAAGFAAYRQEIGRVVGLCEGVISEHGG